MLRAIVRPLLLALVPGIPLALLSPAISTDQDAINTRPVFSVFVPMALIIQFLCICWAAAAWHRFVLLGERPGLFPRFRLKRILHYLWCALMTGVLSVLCALPFFFFFTGLLRNSPGIVNDLVVSASFGLWRPNLGDPQNLLLFGMMFLTLFVPTYVLLRLSPILPAAALGKPLSCGKSWRATRDGQGSIALLAVGYAAVSLFLSPVLQSTIILPLEDAGPLVEIILVWILLVIGLSVITTIYRHVVVEDEGAG